MPVLVRPRPNGGYEMVSGHRRKYASELAGKQVIPCIIRNMTDDEATIIMVISSILTGYSIHITKKGNKDIVRDVHKTLKLNGNLENIER